MSILFFLRPRADSIFQIDFPSRYVTDRCCSTADAAEEADAASELLNLKTFFGGGASFNEMLQTLTRELKSVFLLPV